MSNLTNNTASLQDILNTANALPNACSCNIPTPTAPNMHLVTDASGNMAWEGLHAGLQETVVVLEETTYENGEDGIWIQEPLAVFPEVGKTYNVAYNGVAYACPGVAADMGGVICTVLGNAAAAGGSEGNADAPFMIVALPPEAAANMGGTYVLISDMSGATSVTVAITGPGEIVARGLNYIVKATRSVADGSGTQSAGTSIAIMETSYADVLAAVNAGKNVVVWLTDTSADLDTVLLCFAGIMSAYGSLVFQSFNSSYTILYMSNQGTEASLAVKD